MNVMLHAKAARALPILIAAIAALAVAVEPLANVRAAGPWFVSPAGDDGNDCLSSTTACRTIGGAAAKASA